jgi:polyphosphate kinase
VDARHVDPGDHAADDVLVQERDERLDLGLLSADPELGSDLTDLFNSLTGYSNQRDYRTLLVAPHGVRDGLLSRIRAEADNARAGRPSGIRLKANSLVDEAVIDALYEASRAGVPIDVVVRSICALRPGVEGLSSSIRVRSVVGRFLEHSRITAFTNGGDQEFWMGSADLMHRNLDRRVETLVRVKDPTVQKQLDGLFRRLLDPDARRWDLDAEGRWHRQGTVDVHAALLRDRG